MFMKKMIKLMGGGAGGGDGGGGNGEPECGKRHKNCPEPSNDSYCKLPRGHSGKHECDSCGKNF